MAGVFSKKNASADEYLIAAAQSILDMVHSVFFFNDTAPTEIYTLSLHDALPILKPAVDEALKETPSVQSCIVVKRTGSEIQMEAGRDHWWHDLMPTVDANCRAEELDSEHPLFILYTSGTTGKPKGILHTTGGYLLQAHLTTKWIFDLRDEDIYWCTADIGWV